MEIKSTYQKGFAHLFILLLVIIVAVVAVFYLTTKSPSENLSDSFAKLRGKTPTPSETVSSGSLEDQLNQLESEDTDPSEDFNDVDTDITNL